jgi:uncharacterized UBP type Zn finger protein
LITTEDYIKEHSESHGVPIFLVSSGEDYNAAEPIAFSPSLDTSLAIHRKQVEGSEEILKWPQVAKGRPSRGLHNRKAYCYRRVALQVLLHTPAFLNFINDHDRTPCHIHCIVCAIQTVLLEYWSEGNHLNILTLEIALSRLDDIINDIVRSNEIGPRFTTTKDPKGEGMTFRFLQFLFNLIERDTPAHQKHRLEDLFRMRMVARWTCEYCQTIMTKETEPHYMPLQSSHPRNQRGEIAPGLTLEEYFNSSMTNLQHCEKCKNPSCETYGLDGFQRKIEVEIERGPEILIVQFTRREKSRRKRQGKILQIMVRYPIPPIPLTESIPEP